MHSLLRTFSKIDLYGYKVPLSFKGKTSFTTPVGSFLTFFLVSLVIAFGGYKAIVMFQLGDSKFSTYMKQEKLDLFDVKLYPINELGFDIAIGYELPTNIGDLNFVKEIMRHTLNVTTGLTDFTVQDTILEKMRCGETGLNYTNTAEIL
jgi:hypothetical protein